MYTGSTERPDTEVKSVSSRMGSLPNRARQAATSERSAASSRSFAASCSRSVVLSVELMGVLPA